MEHTTINVKMHSVSKGYLAYGIFDGKGITLLKGSVVSNEVKDFVRNKVMPIRQRYVDEDLKTIEDIYFNTPSEASNFVSGRSTNGWDHWVMDDGNTISGLRNSIVKKPRNKGQNPSSLEHKKKTVERAPIRVDIPIQESTSHIKIKSETVPEGSTIINYIVPGENKTEGNHRIEKKLDSLLSTLSSLYSDKPNHDTSKETKSEQDKRYRIAAIQCGMPLLVCKQKTTITNLITAIKLTAAGIGTSKVEYCVFFIDKDYKCVSNKLLLNVTVGEEYKCQFEFNTSVCEEETVYLAIQTKDSLEEELIQLIEFPVRIAFGTDFGL